jgi:acetolactate synthase-1/2/3 large subunit
MVWWKKSSQPLSKYSGSNAASAVKSAEQPSPAVAAAQSAVATKKASDLFVEALENEGVDYVFAVPGEENLDLLDSLRRSTRIRLILTRHEQGAGFMAAVYGRLTGRAGVCMATLGPGATNLVTPAAYAHLGAFPMIMITGQKPIKRSKQGRFQIVDVVRLFEPVCKMSKQIVNGNMIPTLVREAFRLAEEERPGPVLLELPEDIATEETTAHLIEPHPRRYAAAEEDVFDEAVAMVRAAKAPLILIGAGANRARVRSAMSELIFSSGLPYFTTQMGKGVVDGRTEQHIGTAALSDGDYLHNAVDYADLIINIGHDVTEKPPFFMEHGGKQVIHVNYKAAQVDPVYFPQLEVVGCLETSLVRLTAKLGKVSQDMTYFATVRDKVKKHTTDKADDPRFPPIPQRIVGDIRKVMGDADIIALDNGMYKLWFARNYRAYQPNTVLLDNALATMGAGLPSAMVAAMLNPDRRVMAICGDGGFMMNSQELETAVRLGLNLVVTVLNDGAYGMIRWKQALAGFPDYGLEFRNPDFVAYAKSYGVSGHLIETTDSIIPTIDAAFKAGGVHLIDMPVDYSENTLVLIEELKHRGSEL